MTPITAFQGLVTFIGYRKAKPKSTIAPFYRCSLTELLQSEPQNGQLGATYQEGHLSRRRLFFTD